MTSMIARRIRPLVGTRSAATPVLLLEDPRGVGKSTLLAGLAEAADAVVIDLDRDDYLQVAVNSPAAAIAQERWYSSTSTSGCPRCSTPSRPG